MPKPLKIILSIITVVVLLNVFVYQLVNWNGRRAWAEVEAELKAAGEPVTREDLIARIKRVPDEENFCAIDLLYGIAEVVDGDEGAGEPAEKRRRLEALNVSEHFNESRGDYRQPRAPNFRTGAEWDFENWAAFLVDETEFGKIDVSEDPKAIVENFLQSHDSIFSLLDVANDRPESVIVPASVSLLSENERLIAMQVPHFNSIQHLSRALELRAGLASENEDGNTCRESVISLLKLTQAATSEKSVIGLLVATSTLMRADDSIFRYLKDGLYESDQDLAELGKAIAAVDLSRAIDEDLSSERVMFSEMCEWLRDERVTRGFITENMDNTMRLIQALPSGWIDQNRAHHSRAIHLALHRDESTFPGLNGLRTRLGEETKNLGERKAKFDPKVILAALVMPVYKSCVDKAAYAEAMRVQWLTAVALERYRLANGDYPVSLDQLKEAYLSDVPLDPLDAQPIRYRKFARGYQLYSIGLDGTDDGGAVNLDIETPERTRFHSDEYDGDWVWEIDRSPVETAPDGEPDEE